MKKNWLMLLVICSVCAFSACSDDDDKKDVKIPATIQDMPETAEVGETITITGEGFAATAKFALRNEAEEDLDMETTVISDKEVSCIVPVVDAGVYKVIFIQDDKKWNTERTIEISVPERKPRVKEMLFENSSTTTCSFEYDDDGRISTINYQYSSTYENEDGENEEYNESEVYKITYENNKIVVTKSSSQAFIYDLENGLIKNTSYEDEDGLGNYAWEYDKNNYLTRGGYGYGEGLQYKYTENNLTSIGYEVLAMYEGTMRENKFELIDPVICVYQAVSNVLMDVDLVAHWLGICGKSSVYLPGQMDVYDENVTIQYTMDSKYPEYVSEARAEGEYSGRTTLKFIYE